MPVQPGMRSAQVEIIPRPSVFVRFPGGAPFEITDDRINLVRLAIDRMAMQGERRRRFVDSVYRTDFRLQAKSPWDGNRYTTD